LLALTQSYIQFLLVLLFLVTPGFSVPDHGLAVGINWWFRQRLGLAMSLASIGFAVGGFTLTPMVGWLVLGYGWRWAAGVSGALMLLMSVPIALLFRQPKPGDTISEDKALLARLDGGPAADGHTGSQNTELVVKDFTVKEALQTKAYWLLGLSLGLRLMGQTILMVHIVPILVSKGIGEGTAAALVALVALVRLPSSIAAGVLADQWHRQRTAAITMAMGAMACAVLLWGPSGVSIGVAFAILFGMAHASNAVTWALLGQFFGRRRFGTLRGGISLAPSLTMALGPVAAGWSYDLTGSYFSTLVAVSFLYVVAGMIFWALKTPQPES
jgi:MFS family permease